MQRGKVFYRSEDLFFLTGDQVSRLAYYARHQCDPKMTTQVMEILNEILEKQQIEMPSECSEKKENYSGFAQGDPIQRLDDTPFQQGDPIEKLR